ncbi:MAG TPA: glycosyltransferase, partial [Thermoanaerobaculia bacterium]|nr:glycosyltransferase [Thermoanaerobaculia bacterium]
MATASGRPAVSVVLVHYRAAELAAQALAAAAADLAAAGVDHELSIVDNGSDAAEREALAALPARLLEPGENLGFAGGVNLGVAASRGEVVVLMNPDVTVLPGCLPALVAALGGGAGIAGPRFFWDRGRRLLLPPAETRGAADELLAALAGDDGRWAARARARWRR